MLERASLLAAAVVAGLSSSLPARAQQTLDATKARGRLVCGIGTGIAGFGLPESRGVWQGMDVDLCRSLAVAVLNGAAKVRLVPLTSSARCTALGAGAVDVLFRTSAQTTPRDVTLGLRHVAAPIGTVGPAPRFRCAMA